MTRWTYDTMDVIVDWDDVEKARDEAVRKGRDLDALTVPAEVDIDEALELATVDQLRAALSREQPGYTEDQVRAVHDCFAAVTAGDLHTASVMLARIFEHAALLDAAERGMGLFVHRRVA